MAIEINIAIVVPGDTLIHKGSVWEAHSGPLAEAAFVHEVMDENFDGEMVPVGIISFTPSSVTLEEAIDRYVEQEVNKRVQNAAFRTKRAGRAPREIDTEKEAARIRAAVEKGVKL